MSIVLLHCELIKQSVSEIWRNLTYLNLVMGIWFQAPAIYLLLPQLPQEMTLDSKVVKSKAMRSDRTKPIFWSKPSVTEQFTNIWDGKKNVSNWTDVLNPEETKLNKVDQVIFFSLNFILFKKERNAKSFTTKQKRMLNKFWEITIILWLLL